ncbi:unnamed protein product [Pylaiella littoralis]
MATSEEARPLIQCRSATNAGENVSLAAEKDRKGTTLKGVVITAFTALTVFLLAATASRTIFWEDRSLSVENTTTVDGEEGGDASVDSPPEAAADSSLRSPSGLINPYNGTHPTLTTTEDCTADTSLPVLGGVDVVSFWALSEEEAPVRGTPTLMAPFGDYRFFFSSIENLRAFERNPVKYIPAYGGFCSYGVAAESVWNVDNLGPFSDPSEWKIYGGKLYIFRSRLPKLKWSLAPKEFVEAANVIWNSWFPVEDDPAPINTACLCSEELCTDA